MLKRILLVLGSLGIVITISLPVYAEQFTGSKQQACAGLSEASVTGGSCNSGSTTVHRLLVDTVNVVATVGGIIAIIMIIVAGMKFITSGGDPQGVASARSNLVWAAVGIVVVVMAEVLVHFVLQVSTKNSIPPAATNQTQPLSGIHEVPN